MSTAPSDLARQIAENAHGPEAAQTLWRQAAEHETKRTRLTPRQFDATVWLDIAVRAAPERFRRIPSSAITEDGSDDDGDYAFVTCPCGEHPIARSLIAKCPGCERWYLLAALNNVWVVYGEMEPPPLP